MASAISARLVPSDTYINADLFASATMTFIFGHHDQGEVVALINTIAEDNAGFPAPLTAAEEADVVAIQQKYIDLGNAAGSALDRFQAQALYTQQVFAYTRLLEQEFITRDQWDTFLGF